MLNDILDGITRKIYELFGDGYEIYLDPVRQGLKEPCFFVQVLEPTERQIVGRRYYLEMPVAIQYLPGKREDLVKDMNRVAETLFSGTEYITLSDGSLIRGRDRSARQDLEQEVLRFLVSYRLTVLRKVQETEAMENVILEKGLVN